MKRSAWKAKPETGFSIRFGTIDTGTSRFEITDGDSVVALVTHFGSDAETESHALLMAASPELLKALKKYVDHYGDPLKCARPAIAKAEGRA